MFFLKSDYKKMILYSKIKMIVRIWVIN